MSSQNQEFCKNNANCLQSVIIKGFMGEPTVLQFVKNCGKSTTVLCRDRETQMNYANDVVYQYDEEVYLKLKSAFDSGDTKRLAREWQCAKLIVIP